MAIKPDKHEAWYNRGVSLDDLGRYEEAIASYDRALRIRRERGDRQGEAQSLQTLAGIYQQVGRVREGFVAAQQMAQILQELGTPVETMPYPNWLKPVVKFAKFADRGKWQVGLVITLSVLLLPVILPVILLGVLGIAGLTLWRVVKAQVRR